MFFPSNRDGVFMTTSEDNSFSYAATLMGTRISLTLFELNEELVVQAFKRIKRLEDLLTVNRSPSEVMNINHAAGRHPVAVSPIVYQLIKRALQVSLLDNSHFNFTIGPLVKLWKIGFSGHTVPDAADIQQRLALTDPRHVILNDEDRSVFLLQEGMEIDLGAIAKGYIADVIKGFLRQNGVENALLNLGGNVQAMGRSLNDPQGRWSIGLKKPFCEQGELIGVMRVIDKSVVTSGTYERYFTLDGERYHHILDPQSGYPLNNELDSVTIVSDESIDGDIYTTLMYGMGVNAGIAYLQDHPGISAIFVTKDRQIILSPNPHYEFELLDSSYTVVG